MKIITIIFILNCIRMSSSASSHFTYGVNDPFGPNNWKLISPFCDGAQQSPINIDRSKTIKGTEAPLIMDYFTKRIVSINITNSGHSIDLYLNFVDSQPNRLLWKGDSLETYLFHFLHFHWGSVGSGGSEHTVDGRRFGAEIHLVHYNQKYSNINDAIARPDGLAVIAVFFEFFKKRHGTEVVHHNEFTKYLNQVKNAGQSYLIQNLPIFYSVRDIMGVYPDQYYSYKGSLTTPSCAESVRWIVAKQLVKIHQSEIEKLSQLLDDAAKPLTNNFRPVQNLNNRVVYNYNFRSFEKSHRSSESREHRHHHRRHHP